MAAQDKKQQQMNEQIRTILRKKDYYDILEITKSSTDAEIKKSYKRLALRFHPDKNNTAGSKQVFNKVSNAYACLIDPEKKAAYDRYGPEEDRQPQFRPQRQYRQGYSQQDEFEDIFRAFFGGMPSHNRYQTNHFQTFTFNMGGPRQQNNQNGNGNKSSLYLLLIVIFCVYILPIFIPKQKPLFSTNPSGVYKIPLKTSIFQVPYFVREEYITENKNGKYTRQIEQTVDTQFYFQLKKQCDVQQWTTRGQNTQSVAARRKLRPNCIKLEQLHRQHQDYINDLAYSYSY